MRTLLDDLRASRRALLAKPGFTLAAVLTIALGIGANTTVFSAIWAILLRPLPWRDSGSLVAIWQTRADGQQNVVSTRSYLIWKKRARSFSEMSALAGQYFNISGDGNAEQVRGGLVTAEFFPMLGVSPVLGRLFVAQEDQPGAPRVVLLSHALWQQRYGSRRDMVGRSITINGVPHEVTGVLPADFQFLSKELMLWTPLAPVDDARAPAHTLRVYGRLAPGASLQRARAEMAAIAKALDSEQPASNRGWGADVTMLHEELVGRFRPSLMALWAAAGALLLIAISNVANLMLARAAARTQEVALRCAVGASPGAIIRQLLTESLVLGGVGALAGLALSAVAVRLIAAAGSVRIERLDQTRIDLPVVAFTAALTLVAAVLFGLIPALHSVSTDLVSLLKEEGRGTSSGRAMKRWQRWLVSGQVALSVVLLTGSAVLLRSFVRLQTVDRGFRSSQLLTLRVALPPAEYSWHPKMRAYAATLQERLQSLPGVDSAAVGTGLPLVGMHLLGMEYRLPEVPSGTGARPIAVTNLVSASYFTTLGIRLREGRLFDDRDHEDAAAVIILSRSAARRHWGDTSAVGKRIVIAFPRGPASRMPREVIGVVDDIVYPGGVADEPVEIYFPFAQSGWPNLYLFLRTRSEPYSIAAAARKAIQEIDAGVPVSAIRSLEDLVSEQNGSRRFDSQLAGALAVLALLLTVVGVYGVVSCAAERQTREIAVRVAFGAQPGDIVRFVIRDSFGMIAAGLAVGLAVYAGVSGLLERLLYGLVGGPSAYLTFGAAAVFLAILCLLASLIPARRTSLLDPAKVLHEPPRW